MILAAQNQVLFYNLLSRHLEEMVSDIFFVLGPVTYCRSVPRHLYTDRGMALDDDVHSVTLIKPVQAEAISGYSHLFRQPEGLYLSPPSIDKMEEDFLDACQNRELDLVSPSQ